MTTAALTFSTKDGGDPRKREGKRSEERGRRVREFSDFFFCVLFMAPPTCDVTVMRGGWGGQMKRIAEGEL